MLAIHDILSLIAKSHTYGTYILFPFLFVDHIENVVMQFCNGVLALQVCCNNAELQH